MLKSKGYVLTDVMISVAIVMIIVNVTYACIAIRLRVKEGQEMVKEMMNQELIEGYSRIERCELCVIEEEVLP